MTERGHSYHGLWINFEAGEGAGKGLPSISSSAGTITLGIELGLVFSSPIKGKNPFFL